MTVIPPLAANRLDALVKTSDSDKRRRAALAVAARARDAGDCAELLDMLGLTVADARPGRTAA